MMRRVILASLVVLASVSALEASSLRCHYNIDCYNCVSGMRYDDCSLDCNVCGGTVCLGMAEALPPALTANAEPLQALHRFSTKPIGEAIHPDIARVFDWFLRWHGSSPVEGKEALQLGGGVVINGKPRDFTLDVVQSGDAQMYFLRVQSFGKVTLTVDAPVDGRQELRYEIRREGGRVRSGSLQLEAQ